MGWDLRGGARAKPDSEQAFERSAPPFPSAEERFALLAVAARGFRPPRLLTAIDLASASGADQSGVTGVEYPGLRQTWSLLYRRITETNPSFERPYAIYLLGVNAPIDATPEDLKTFNDFYSNVHLVEVARRRQALRAVRYELAQVVRAPYPSAPQFLAAYELNEDSASHRRHVGPSYSAGPDVWQRHTTPWRLWYRRLGS